MVIAETKRQMHETLEMKEDEIAQLRSRLQQATAQKEEMQEQKEKAEKSGQRCKMLLPLINQNFGLSLNWVKCFDFPPKLLRSWNGLWVSLRRRRRPESSSRFSWRSKWGKWKELAKRRGRVCSRSSHGSSRRSSPSWRSGRDFCWMMFFCLQECVGNVMHNDWIQGVAFTNKRTGLGWQRPFFWCCSSFYDHHFKTLSDLFFFMILGKCVISTSIIISFLLLLSEILWDGGQYGKAPQWSSGC